MEKSAAHVLENRRMTLMFCAFAKQPLILRLSGLASIVSPGDDAWPELAGLFSDCVGARQIFRLELNLVLTSCGYGVPCYQLLGERPTLTKWAMKKGREGIGQYWQDNNTVSLNGKSTDIFKGTE